MAFKARGGREQLNISSYSPLVPSKDASSRTLPLPELSRLPWKEGRSPDKFDRRKLVGNKFGTPGYPSPLDRIRKGLRLQESPLGSNASFSHLPRHPPEDKTFPQLNLAKSLPRLNKLPGDGLHSFSFSPGHSKGSFGTCGDGSQGGNWFFHNYVGGGTSRTVFPTSIVNPNKAVLTLDAEAKILTSNDMSSLLLGHSGEELSKMKLTDFLSDTVSLAALPDSLRLRELTPSRDPGDKTKTPVPLQSIEHTEVLQVQGMVLFSGKVVGIETADNGTMPVSLWLKALPLETGEEQRWIAVLEPVDVTIATVKMDSQGTIISHDKSFNLLFGYPNTTSLANLLITDFMPALDLPKDINDIPVEIQQQQCTGQTMDCATFPLCAQIKKYSNNNDTNKADLELEIWVFSNISGLVVLDESGAITDYNHNFTRILFGYGHNELQGKDITHLIPTFFDDVSLCQKVNSPSFDDSDSDDSITDTDTESPQKENSVPTDKKPSNKESSSKSSTISTLVSEQFSLSNANQGFIVSDSKLQSSLYGSVLCNSTAADSSQNSCSSTQINSGKAAMKDITSSLNLLNLTGQNASRNGTQNSSLGNLHSPNVTKQHSNSTSGLNASPIKCIPKIQLEGYGDFPRDLGTEDLVTSTPAVGRIRPQENHFAQEIEEGSFFGVGKHKDGTDLVIIYQIRRLEMNGRSHYCLWILRDPEEPQEGNRTQTNLTMPSALSQNTEYSLGQVIQRESAEQHSRGISQASTDDGTSLCTSTDGSSGAEYSLNHSRRVNRENSSFAADDPVGEEKLITGEYRSQYTILRQIGKGAFGCVKMSYRNSDGKLVVTKFIKKASVYEDSWVDDSTLGCRVPLEVSLLLVLDHPNIVKVYDVFENDDYFQLVMEKWGAGMDLFEFIDRNPIMDEPLAAHIFRQIVSALKYLHSLNVIHRDVKDENVIINHNFDIKLIDFGSSAFIKPGVVFSQFAGTVEYCSPEVLKGNRYSGHELEVWSLGITLYTLIYGENPFYDVDETMKAELTFPIRHSDELPAVVSGCRKYEQKEPLSAHINSVWMFWTHPPCPSEEYVPHWTFAASFTEANSEPNVNKYSNELFLNTVVIELRYKSRTARYRFFLF
ncbi:unnamed protein product, partial [Meganyctiphanes norvegica]